MANKNANKEVIKATNAYPGERLVRVKIPLISEDDGDVFVSVNGTVTLYSGDAVPNRYITVPNLEGLSASGANQRIVNAGLNPVITGATNSVSDATALVVSQEPAAACRVCRADEAAPQTIL